LGSSAASARTDLRASLAAKAQAAITNKMLKTAEPTMVPGKERKEIYFILDEID
jgi:hypothetical protein